jgi:steroid delta-isomerase-like uncharacterized protein
MLASSGNAAHDGSAPEVSMGNKQIVRRWFEDVWNRRDASAIPRLMAADAVAHGLTLEGQDLVGPKGFLPFHTSFTSAFGDLQIVLDDLIEEDDRVAARWHTTGTLTGDGLGVPPTGRSMAITGMTILRVRDGVIVEAWNNFDVLGMHRQLGTIAAVL